MRYSYFARTLFAIGFALSLCAASAHAETGVTETSIKIGMSGPFSGANGAYGTEMRTVIQQVFSQTNAAGGINGRKLELVALDDGYETERAVANTTKLLQEQKVFALTGYYGSTPTTASMQVFSAAKTPLIGTISGADSLRNPVNRYMFNVRASYADETEAIVKQLVSIDMKNVGVFYQNDGFGKSGLDGVTAALKKYNITSSVVATVERNSTDVDKAVAAFAKARPQAIVMVTLYKPTTAFVRKLHEADVHPFLATLSPVGADTLATELGDSARGILISQVMPYPWDDTKPIIRDYLRLIKKFDKNAKPSYYGIEAYVNAVVLIEAIKSAGREPTREKLVDALENMRDLNLGGYQISFSAANHSGSKRVEITVLGSKGKVLR
jgi:ABC-type branched-subunit amino acid transport system substrate-binding protein